jgi:hypothetical protein
MSLLFAPNPSLVPAHRDLMLSVGDESWLCDSYYFEDGDATRGEILAALLAQWRRDFDALADGGVCYWPYDFSDQYTGWVRVERHGDEVELHVGWSEEPPGHAMFPRGDGGQLPEQWQPRKGSAPVRMSIAACAAAIDESRRLLAKK